MGCANPLIYGFLFARFFPKMKNMLDVERDEQILALLQKKKAFTVYELAQTLFVSESTIRRDLARMEQKGLITRTFGGALLKSNPIIEDTSFFLREKESLQEKRALVKEATKYIQSNTAIFVDSSTTCLQMVSLLNDFVNLLIVTNGLVIANEIVSKTKHRVSLLGGEVQPSTNSVLGTKAENMAKTYHASLAIMSTSGVDLSFGLSEQTEQQAALKNIMRQNSDMTIVLADAKKIGKKSLAKTCDLKDIDVLITTGALSEAYQTAAPKTKFIHLGFSE